MEDLKRLCVEFINSYDSYFGYEKLEPFISGFKLGMKMILEIMYDDGE